MENVKFAFEDLNVYEKALGFVDLAYDTSFHFSKHEMYGLISQLNRSAVSIALNITEDSGDSDPQFNRFLQLGKSMCCLLYNSKKAKIFNRGERQ